MTDSLIFNVAIMRHKGENGHVPSRLRFTQCGIARIFLGSTNRGSMCAMADSAGANPLARWASDNRTPLFHFQSKGLDREETFVTDIIEDRDRADRPGPRPAVLRRIRARATKCR